MTDNEINIDPAFWRDDLDGRPVMVSIRCITYNHEPYIRDALEGFVNQKTNFRFEAIVHDDASTDGTAAIIREYAEKYPSIIKPILETENQYSKRNGSLRRIMDAHMRGKYIAMCEGDDYWIDPLKLQKQVNLMENNKDYVLCYSKALISSIDNNNSVIGRKIETFDELLLENHIPTLTVLYLSSMSKLYDLKVNRKGKGWKMGDYPKWLWMSKQGKFGFIDEVLATYRLLDESASHSKNINNQLEFYINACDIAIYMCEFFSHSIPEKLKIRRYWFSLVDDIINGKLSNLKEKTKDRLFDSLGSLKKLFIYSYIYSFGLSKPLLIKVIKNKFR